MLTTLGLVLLAVIVVLLIGVTIYQIATEPFMGLFHLCNGTLSTFGGLLVLIIQAIGEAASSALSD
jgi:hypothetical protein